MEYTPEQKANIRRYEDDLTDRMVGKAKRLAHSLSVGREAERLAQIYGVDPYGARVAGILHDWEKIAKDAELIDVARDMGIDLGVDLELVKPLLHGKIAARTLAERYPELSPEILSAIDKHTTGAREMSPLDMVVFIADGIEPLRKSVPAIEEQRAQVGTMGLSDLYQKCFTDGMAYVLATKRYLWPETVAIYNHMIQKEGVS